MKITLTTSEIESLKAQHKLERDKRIADRIKAVILIHEGWSVSAAAKVLLISEDSIARYVSAYVSEKKLCPSNGGSTSKLTCQQTETLLAHLVDHTYVSTQAIVNYVFDTYGIAYTCSGMYQWLILHGFSYKKAIGIPAKLDPEKQKAFLEIYNKLKVNLPEDEKILFMDSVHPTQATKLEYGWIRKGQVKEVPTAASRKRISLTGALDVVDKTLIVQEYETINGDTIVEFLRDLEAKYPKASKIHIIADGASSHCNKAVSMFLNKPNEVNRSYLKNHYSIELPNNSVILSEKFKKTLEIFVEKEDALFTNKCVLNTPKLTARLFLESFLAPSDKPPPKIQLHILPPYSPNLNPIERVWKVMNEHARNNKFFPTFKLFREAIMHFFTHTWEEIKPKMDTRINDNFQVLNSASSF
jgi:transposase